MGLVEELKEIDNERKRNYNNAYETKKNKEEYINKKRWLRNRERLKTILEDDNPELDKPFLVKISYPENHSKYSDRYTYHRVLTKRTMEILKLIEEWRVEKWTGDAKTTYKRSNRKLSRDEQETMMHIEKKVRAIYSSDSDDKNNKCIAAISERTISPNGDCTGWTTLPTVRYGDGYYPKYGLAVDTKLKYALLANVSDKENTFELITQEPKEIQNYENRIKNAATIIKDYEETHPKQESDSKITFTTIKSAIKKHLLGKGERD